MPSHQAISPFICARCLRANGRVCPFPTLTRLPAAASARCFADSTPQPRENDVSAPGEEGNGVREPADAVNREDGAMSRQLRSMSESALESNTRGARKTIAEAGFSEDLKRQLEERIASANFRAEHRSAFTEVALPSHAGRHTRDIATGEAWAGQESVHDASLRMLNDAHRPLRLGREARIPGPGAAPPKSVDTGRRTGGKMGTRLANARDRSGLYATLKDSDMSHQEREKRFQELKDRFSPDARSVVPGTIQGLANLANQRIEDAIARGQFKNLPRGKKIERDYIASNPFLNTTEYFMNKMIQKQEIVPPWIEKQQELVSAATKFRSRLRNDWRRHAARVIASKGGTLQEQMRKAEAYAKAEMIANPPKKKDEKLNVVNDGGHVSQISLSGELKVPRSDSTPLELEINAEKISLDDPKAIVDLQKSESTASQTMNVPLNARNPPSTISPSPYPFRDPEWERTESAFLTLSISDLNNKTRSYNLQAPDLAKKPYFSLERELNACYADVAPQLADAIRERALSPKAKTVGFGESIGGGGVMDRLMGERVRVRDEKTEKQYGFRQLWRDIWGGEERKQA
ncbi:hypothetical protein CC78DRAFT_463241 [Lojkania enalia]|uniref:DnaJ homologue subfamily C member 28 conserved domain-containing protein n=1 Tax=Lojkania enalia TaxID=147567 RepID=A0A9P4K8Q3_9PLEO|nr:hypothetical protein CC78DRAFT_463241 [Didymosphaeria enalia]